jgi:hypothetical protein
MPDTKAKTTKKDAVSSTEKKAKPAGETAAKSSRSKKEPVLGDGQYPIYDPAASRDSYKVGDIVKFEKVRDWLNKGELIEARGKVVGISVFDKTIPYLEVSFSDVKKLNKVDLGSDVRKFILEQK